MTHRIVLTPDLLRTALQVAIKQLTGGQIDAEIMSVSSIGADNQEVPFNCLAIHYESEPLIEDAEFTEVEPVPAITYRGKPSLKLVGGTAS
jgi:hypothetical protein